ncbi:hypothetical protein SAMN04488023_1248 [Pedobacter rhizosphaerae]|uniref:Uncharacterized protein n=1 Tax=Pedobacter rhizosphaerae TaxID=390241 RepID=A0A1H9TPI3_9SPHI|nr:hypothetical protein SAMN04488023_1248 [Pedobacter rhizosphaerae]
MSKNVNPKVKIRNDTRNENYYGRSETLELERVIRNNSYHISHIRKHKHSLFNHTVLKPTLRQEKYNPLLNEKE